MGKSNKFLFKAYTIIVFFTALLTFSSIFILKDSLDELQNEGRIINLAGRQRMMSQGIVKELLYTQLDESDSDRRAEIIAAVNTFKSGQHDLLTGNIKVGLSKMDDPSIKEFHKVDFQFNAFTRSLSINLKSKIPARELINVMRVQKQFLASMDKFVFFLDVRNKQTIAFFPIKRSLSSFFPLSFF